MKHVARKIGTVRAIQVALHGGAWIETDSGRVSVGCAIVALHGGAWIETSSSLLFTMTVSVALHGGAWIETVSNAKSIYLENRSPFTEGRGMKQ